MYVLRVASPISLPDFLLTITYICIQVGLSTSILGGISTLIASYLARVRGSGEPELSTSRVKDLAQFVRECEAFVQDYGYVVPYSKGSSPPVFPYSSLHSFILIYLFLLWRAFRHSPRPGQSHGYNERGRRSGGGRQWEWDWGYE